jgi:hypothetical protein
LILAVAASVHCANAESVDDSAGTSPPAAQTENAGAGDASSTAVPDAPPQADTSGQRRRHARLPNHRTLAQRLDENVRRLSRGLDLDADQQQTLRQILVEQHHRLSELRSGKFSPSMDVAGVTMGIYEQSRARIRAMLTDEQRQKYAADVPHDGLAPAQADLQHWLDLQASRRRQSPSEAEAP